MSSTTRSDRREVSRLLSVWLPLLVAIIVLGGRAAGESFYNRFIAGESGIVENLTLVFLAVAIFVAVRLLTSRGSRPHRYVSAWLALFTLGCVVFAGEEASWGQHLVGWQTPEEWRPGWGQQETNLRNVAILEPLLDTVARDLLGTAVFVGGLIVPLWRRRRRTEGSGQGAAEWFWPTAALAPAAAWATFCAAPWKILHLIGAAPPWFLDVGKPGEMRELYLALYLMLYVVSLQLRLRASNAVAQPL